MLNGIYKQMLNKLALANVIQTADIPKATLGVFPFENLDRQALKVPYKFTYPERHVQYTQKTEDPISISNFGNSLNWGY